MYNLTPIQYYILMSLSRNLWNNLLQPEGSRTTDYRLVGPLVCPSQRSPYLALGSAPGYSYPAQEALPAYVP
jgi:hypothetical protein